MRVGVTKGWVSRWFGGKRFRAYLQEDVYIRQFLDKKLRNMAVDRIEIERTATQLSVMIFTARPGLIIGRGGSGVDELKKELVKKIKAPVPIKIEIQEFKEPETSANIMSETIAEQLERRMPFRRVMKQALNKISTNRNVSGVKVQLAGRLNGAEIARTESLREGTMPLQTLKADIDFAKATAHTTYGTIGIKVWIHKEAAAQS